MNDEKLTNKDKNFIAPTTGGTESQSEQLLKKQAQWEAIRRQLDEATDALGLPIDEGIKDTCIALNALGFPTEQSCEGHTNEPAFNPWVRISDTDEPWERFANQRQIFQEVAAKKGLTFKQVASAENYDAYWEAMKKAAENPELPQYVVHRQRNQALKERFTNLLSEFYQDREVPDEVHLNTHAIGADDCFYIENPGSDEGINLDALSSDEKSTLDERVKQRQAEMQAFTEFLKQKYFFHPQI